MLKGIAKYLSPELLYAIYCMGHGDEIVLADAHFPGHSINENVIRADGVDIEDLLQAILPLFAIDNYVDDPLVMMQPVTGDQLDPAIEESYYNIITKFEPKVPKIIKIDRFTFYERAKSAFAVVITGCAKKYGSIILKKGVTT
jgi:L-fucose mutarotase